MDVRNLSGLDDEAKASKFLAFMFCEGMNLVIDIIEGRKTLEELGKPITKEYLLRHPVYQKMQLKHSDIAKILLNNLMDTEFMDQEDKNIITFFPPVIQSGGLYDVNKNSDSDENYFSSDIIILHISLKYKQYYLSLIRTIMVTPTANVKLEENYKFLLEVQNFIIETLRDGVELGKIYEATLDFVKSKRPKLLQNLMDNFGKIVGIYPKDECFIIKSNSKEIARENTTYIIDVGFHNICDTNVMKQPPHTYSLRIGDCVRVEKGRRATILKYINNQANYIIMKNEKSYQVCKDKTLKKLFNVNAFFYTL